MAAKKVALCICIVSLLSMPSLAQNSPDSDELSNRIQRLEDKLDAILKHLRIDQDATDKIIARGKESAQASPQLGIQKKSNVLSNSELDQMPNNWFVWALFVHEAWLFMQHANVLLNPYLQRLDRK